jgi:DNA-binding NtrC family response regulator
MLRMAMPKILLIDDDATLLNAVTAFIMAARIDMAVDTAVCAEAGLLLMGVSEYDAIISDFRLSGLDGLGLVMACTRLRPGTPVVLISGYGDKDMENEAIRLGAYAFLHKPVQPDMLLSVIDRAVQGARDPHSCLKNETGLHSLTSFAMEQDRLLRKVQEINRRIQRHLESTGDDTVH